MPTKIATSNFQSSASRLMTKEAVVIWPAPAGDGAGCISKQASRPSPSLKKCLSQRADFAFVARAFHVPSQPLQPHRARYGVEVDAGVAEH